MPLTEYVDTISSGYNDYNLEIPCNLWLRGKQAAKTGFIFTESPKMFDIFGFILKAAGYSESQFVGIRVPSQFAQVQRRSGSNLQSIAAFLTTPGHADTDSCIKLGVINDDIKIDDKERQTKIASILVAHSIGVRFVEKTIEPYKMSVDELSQFIGAVVTELEDTLTADYFKRKFLPVIEKERVKFIYGVVGEKVIFAAYDSSKYPLDSLIYQTVLPFNSRFLSLLFRYSSLVADSVPWFKANRSLLLQPILELIPVPRAR